MATPTARAFELEWDLSVVHPDDEHVASLVRFPGCEDVVGWSCPTTREVPHAIYFEANVQTLRTLDYPENNVQWPILSPRMREVLPLGAVPHRLIPVVMLDDTVPTRERFARSGAVRPGVALEGYAAVQLLEHLDVFDWDRSEYTKDDMLPGRVRRLRKLVLQNVALPPLFRLAAIPGRLFVSVAARDALERAGVTGVEYRRLDVVRG